MEIIDWWQDYILPRLEAKFPNSVMKKLHTLYPEKGTLVGALHHLQNHEEIRQFFLEYQTFCRICDMDNVNSDECIAICDIIGHMVKTNGGNLNPLWMEALENELPINEN